MNGPIGKCVSLIEERSSTGEPDAGDPHVRFGGRGRLNPVPYPYQSRPEGRSPRPLSEAALEGRTPRLLGNIIKEGLLGILEAWGGDLICEVAGFLLAVEVDEAAGAVEADGIDLDGR